MTVGPHMSVIVGGGGGLRGPAELLRCWAAAYRGARVGWLLGCAGELALGRAGWRGPQERNRRSSGGLF
jgi:hypothetical protein